MCRRLMLSAALLLIFVGVLPKAIHCLPAATSDDLYHGGSVQVVTEAQNGQCVTFTDHYCNLFENRSMAYFPNPRGHQTPEAAAAEFNHFIPLLKSGCHPKLGTLLCFMYFPLCSTDYPDLKIYPCKEACQEVHNSNCTKLLEDNNLEWNNQLQCSKPHFKSGGLCASGIAPVYPGSMPTDATTDNSTDLETTDTSDVCGNDACPSGCDYRNNANSGTFKRNAYCYAAQVTVKSYEVQGCHHAYTVEVKNQYDLQTPFNSTHSTKAPSMGDSAVILTSPSHCTQCPKLEVSKTYLISGPYSRVADGSIQWKLGDSKDQALVSEWATKYDRKLSLFVSGGNRDRENNSKFIQQCETDNQLVSSEQWINH